jgi:site-specific DNA-methyltransferase (adenine-specific)
MSDYKTGLGFDGKDQNAQTPAALMRSLQREFRFTFDPAPVKPSFDGLKVPWGRRNYVNPPYDAISAWVSKAVAELDQGKVSVFLIPLRMHTRYFCETIFRRAAELRILDGPVIFKGYTQKAPWRSALVVFDDNLRPKSSKLGILELESSSPRLSWIKQTLEKRQGWRFKFYSDDDKALTSRRAWADSLIVMRTKVKDHIERALSSWCHQGLRARTSSSSSSRTSMSRRFSPSARLL